MQEDVLSLVSDIVDRARRLGADQADAFVTMSTESSVRVRLGKVEQIVEAGSHAASVRVIKDQRTSISSTSDLTPKALDEMVQQAIELAKISEPDEFAGLPDRADLAQGTPANLQLYDERLESLSIDEMKESALRCEQAALDFDRRVTNSDGGEMGVVRGQVALANSLGFASSYPSTSVSLTVEAICDDSEGKKRNDYWFSAERALHRLESPEDVGRKAAARAVAKLGARKIETATMAVVWEPRVVTALLGILSEAVSGEALYRRATFLAGLEGEQFASAKFTLTDDPLLAGRLGSRPFDGEGVTSRTLPLFEAGTFKTFLFDVRNARRLKRRTTGAAQRSLTSAPAPSVSNLLLQPGDTSPDGLLAGIEDGLLLTDLMGFGVNLTTGDFSRGAQGFRIEKGKLTYPVTEVNVSGNLKDMLASIDAVGDDVAWFGNTQAASLRMPKLTVSGL